jgi:hypothetical protein
MMERLSFGLADLLLISEIICTETVLLLSTHELKAEKYYPARVLFLEIKI